MRGISSEAQNGSEQEFTNAGASLVAGGNAADVAERKGAAVRTGHKVHLS